MTFDKAINTYNAHMDTKSNFCRLVGLHQEYILKKGIRDIDEAFRIAVEYVQKLPISLIA